MLTGKALFNTLLAELNEMGLPGMSATLDEMYRSPDFVELDPLMAIANLVEPEYREVKVLFEILEKRCEINLSTIICSQREPASWSSMILNDEVSANAILKRATKHYTVVIKPKMTT